MPDCSMREVTASISSSALDEADSCGVVFVEAGC